MSRFIFQEDSVRLVRPGVVILIVALLVGAGCGKREKGAPGLGNGDKRPDTGPTAAGDGVDRPVRGGRLVIGMQQEPEILNEAVNSMVASVYVCNLIFSKFVKYNDRMELVPDLIDEIPTVENGGISPDRLTYTYHIRKNARWHDGVPVTSYDAKFSYQVMVHPDINVETRQGWDVVDHVETPDSHTVVFHLREVYANFVGDCFYDESVLPEHLLRGELGPQFQTAEFHRHPVGSGPFAFKEWVSGSHLIVRANRDYYGEGPYLDEIVIKFIPDGNALVIQLETGEITAVDNAPSTALAVAERLRRFRLFKNAALFNEHLDLNCENPILGEALVRRALALATNRKELSDKVYDGLWLPAFGDDYPRSPYYTAAVETLNAFDPARSMALLSKAGWVDRDGDGIREKNGAPLSLTISTTTGNLNRERTEMVLREQYRAVGVDLRVKNYTPGELYASWDEGGILRRGAYAIALYAALMPPDPSTNEGTYSAAFLPPKGQNFTRIRDERLTRLLAEGSRTILFADRKRIYDEVASIVAREAPAIPLLWVTQLDIMPQELVNYRPNPTQSGDTWNANEWWLKR